MGLLITKCTLDMETLEWVSVESIPYDGPWAELKGAGQQGAARANVGTGANYSNSLYGMGTANEADVMPFLQQEVYNPQGYGQPAMNLATTQAGQAASGKVADATEKANLRAARSGNLAGQSAIIDSASRSGANALTNAQTGAQLANDKAKLSQQQAGAKGMLDLSGQNLRDSLASLGLSNEAINAWSGAKKASGNFATNLLDPAILATAKGGISF